MSGVITGPLAKAQTALPPSSLEAHGGQGPEQWGRLAVQGQGTVVYAPLAPANTTLTHTQDLLTGEAAYRSTPPEADGWGLDVLCVSWVL